MIEAKQKRFRLSPDRPQAVRPTGWRRRVCYLPVLALSESVMSRLSESVMSRDTGVLTTAELLTQILKGIRATGEPDWSLVRPDFQINDPEILDSPVHQGRRGWREWSANWTRVFPDYSLEALDRVELDQDRILTVHRLRARGGASGVELTRTDAQLWTFEGDRLARMDYLADYDPSDQSWAAPDGLREYLK
ncbi:MAG TPA: nuclear transport factor 2 family protein [Thermoleophilaceae bacterium]|jgi:hypothetical protein|nr:nuclear transport factor 2 family protein [Thermoleophilaceae bacterium]